jgi:hypothetical protein
VEFAQIYTGQALFSEIERHLCEREFELIDIVNPGRRAYIVASGCGNADRLMSADAVFFRRAGLDTAPVSFLTQAIIAWLVYGKRSLAEHLFERYDAIADTRIAKSTTSTTLYSVED